MKNLNNYINEAWSGVKRQSLKQEIEAWCEEMGIKKYTINSQGEIDVNGHVNLMKRDLKELPYKFGTVNSGFDIAYNENLKSLKNCPNEVGDSFYCNDCSQLVSLEGCPKVVGWNFFCRCCKRKFTEEEVESLCKVKKKIYVG